MSPFLSSTGPTASLSSNLASNKTSSVNQLINRSSNCCGRSLIRPALSAVWVAASPQCLPLVYITIHFVRSCLLYKGGYRWVRRPSNGRMGTSAPTQGYDRLRRGRCPQRPVDNGCTPWSPSSVMGCAVVGSFAALRMRRTPCGCLRPCHLLPCGAKAIAAPSGALKCRWPSPHPSRLRRATFPQGKALCGRI